MRAYHACRGMISRGVGPRRGKGHRAETPETRETTAFRRTGTCGPLAATCSGEHTALCGVPSSRKAVWLPEEDYPDPGPALV